MKKYLLLSLSCIIATSQPIKTIEKREAVAALGIGAFAILVAATYYGYNPLYPNSTTKKPQLTITPVPPTNNNLGTTNNPPHHTFELPKPTTNTEKPKAQPQQPELPKIVPTPEQPKPRILKPQTPPNEKKTTDSKPPVQPNKATQPKQLTLKKEFFGNQDRVVSAISDYQLSDPY